VCEDVTVIGGGPAGAVTAHVIAAAGCRVSLVDAPVRRAPRFGEGLVPAARLILEELGVFDEFTAEAHLPSFGNESSWGSPAVHRTDFIRSPYGHGWHLDRARFDAMLRNSARAAGAFVHARSWLRAFRDDGDGTWSLDVEGPSGINRIRSRWLVDATGRSSSVARRHGVRRITDDRLLAFAATFRPRRDGDLDSLSFVEAVEEGWWYTALLPSRDRAVVFFTDAGLEAANTARTRQGFVAALSTTLHVSTRLAAFDYEIAEVPRATAASGSRLERLRGPRWLAVGDAAMSFDPLSSQGIFTALYGALKAARALIEELESNGSSLAGYEDALLEVYRHYSANRLLAYRQERRWPHSPFWKPRHR
jgi:flavin-dependent dehydrogenase